MPAGTFTSYAENGADAVLWRALGHLSGGRYVDVGSADPGSAVTRAFHERGWQGLVVPSVDAVELFRAARPDALVAAPISTLDETLVAAAWDGPVHLVHVGAGREETILSGLDLDRWRPWVVVVEDRREVRTASPAWELTLLDAGYAYTLFDGLARFYVRSEHLVEIGPQLDHGLCVLDDVRSVAQQRSEAALAELSAAFEAQSANLVRWRSDALAGWADAAMDGSEDLEMLRAELRAVRQTLSWRVTKPLRLFRTAAGGRAGVVG